MINWTVDLGTLIQVVGFVGTLIYITATLRGDVKTVKTDVVDIKTELKSLRDVVITQAAQTVRIDMLTKRVDKADDDIRLMRMGESFILPIGGQRHPK